MSETSVEKLRLNLSGFKTLKGLLTFHIPFVGFLTFLAIVTNSPISWFFTGLIVGVFTERLGTFYIAGFEQKYIKLEMDEAYLKGQIDGLKRILDKLELEMKKSEKGGKKGGKNKNNS